MKTYIFALAVAALIYGSCFNASVVRKSVQRLNTINVALGGR